MEGQSAHSPTACLPTQGLPEAAAAAERTQGDAAELCSLPQAEALAVVAAVHQGEGTWGGGPGSKEVGGLGGNSARASDFLCLGLSLQHL